MHKLVISEKAERNLEEIHDFIADDNILYAKKVIESINASMQILEAFPLIGTKRGDLRYTVDPNYGYKIVYQIREGEIYVISVSKYRNNEWKG